MTPNQSPPKNRSTGKTDSSSLLPHLPQGSEILIVRLRSLGDLVLETPAIAALHAWRPDLPISVLAEPRFAPILEGNPAIAEIIPSGSLNSTSLELRRRRFPIVFNQHGGPRSAMLTGASGSPLRVGWKGFQYSFVYNVQVPDAEEFYGRSCVHTIEHRLSQFYWTGLPRGPIPSTKVYVTADEQRAVAQKLDALRISGDRRYAVLQPGARLEGMRWPVVNFAAVAKWLAETHGIASVVNCGAQDEGVAREVRDAMRDDAVIPEPLSIRELSALISGAALFVGNDSGPAHIAAALQRPTVVIFSLTDPNQWKPLHATGQVVATGAEFEHPRGDKAVLLRQSRAMTSISLEEVCKACEEVLDR